MYSIVFTGTRPETDSDSEWPVLIEVSDCGDQTLAVFDTEAAAKSALRDRMQEICGWVVRVLDDRFDMTADEAGLCLAQGEFRIGRASGFTDADDVVERLSGKRVSDIDDWLERHSVAAIHFAENRIVPKSEKNWSVWRMDDASCVVSFADGALFTGQRWIKEVCEGHPLDEALEFIAGTPPQTSAPTNEKGDAPAVEILKFPGT